MEQQERFVGRPIPTPAHAADDGSADLALVAALRAYAGGEAGRDAVHEALAGARLLVPVVAVLDEQEHGPDGLAREKDSHMATVTLTGHDGRRGLLAFTGTPALTAWRADARPLPAATARVALAALHEQADAVLLDVAGPVRFPLEGYALQTLAAGGAYRPAHQSPELAAAVLAALAPLPGPPRARLLPGDPQGADLLVQVELGAASPSQVQAALAAAPVLAARCPRGVALAVTG